MRAATCILAALALLAVACGNGGGRKDERIRIEAQRMGASPENLRDELNKGSGMQALKNQLLRERTLDYLTSVANIQSEE